MRTDAGFWLIAMQWVLNNKEWLFSGVLVTVIGALATVGALWYKQRIRLKVMMHRAFWAGSSGPYFFIKITNLSPERDVEVTHVWLETSPKAHLLPPGRPLPIRLRPLETWETWIAESAIPKESRDHPYKLGRAQLSSGQSFRSRKNTGVPEFGFVAGASKDQR
jgi:hypothetical protein